MPPSIVEWLQDLPDGHLVEFRGKPVSSAKSAWRATRERAGLDADVNPYSICHTLARWMRKQGVPAWEVAAQLGHKQREFSTTEIYAPFDPSYLDNAVTAIDRVFGQLRVNCVVLEECLSGQVPYSIGAGEEIRTLDPNLGKVMLYP